MKSSLGISNSLEEISSLSHSIVFLCFLFVCLSLVFFFFFALITEETFLSLLAILWNSTFKWLYLFFSPLSFTCLLSSAICKASPDSHFALLNFFSMRMVLIPVSCTMSQTSFHSSSGTLPIRSSPLNLFPSFYSTHPPIRHLLNHYLKKNQAMLGLDYGMQCLVPWSGKKPGSPALGAWSLSHWIIREVPQIVLFWKSQLALDSHH